MMPRFLYHQCGCLFDIRVQPFTRAHIADNAGDIWPWPLSVWRQTEVSLLRCPWHRRDQK